MKKYFDPKDILQIFKVSRDKFNDWHTRGYIKASIQKKKGKRIFKQYSIYDVYGIAIFKSLIESEPKLSREDAKAIVGTWFKKKHQEDMLVFHLNQQEGEFAWITGIDKGSGYSGALPGAILLINRISGKDGPWKKMVVMNFELIKNEVDEAIKLL